MRAANDNPAPRKLRWWVTQITINAALAMLVAVLINAIGA